MEAVCKADFDKRTKAHNDAEKALEQAKKEGKSTSGIAVPEVGYHDIYGVWFFGNLKEIIQQIGNERFGVDLGKMMHAFTDVEPKKIGDGIHNITVYGYCAVDKRRNAAENDCTFSLFSWWTNWPPYRPHFLLLNVPTLKH